MSGVGSMVLGSWRSFMNFDRWLISVMCLGLAPLMKPCLNYIILVHSIKPRKFIPLISHLEVITKLYSTIFYFPDLGVQHEGAN